jgi:hypothetical protein
LEKLVQKDIEVWGRLCYLTNNFFSSLCCSFDCSDLNLFCRFFTSLSRSMRLPFRIYRHTKRRNLSILAKRTWNWVSKTLVVIWINMSLLGLAIGQTDTWLVQVIMRRTRRRKASRSILFYATG